MEMESKKVAYTPFILAEDGEALSVKFVASIMRYLNSKVDTCGLNFGNSYNMPIYLLGELENCDNPLVFLVNWNVNGELDQKCLVSEYEITELMKELEDRPDDDAWQIAMDVNKRIRAE